MGYDQREMQMLAQHKPKIVDKLDTNIGIRVSTRQKLAMLTLSADDIRAIIVCETCRRLDCNVNPS